MHTENNSQIDKFAAWAPVVIRVVLGIIFVAHGSQKLFGAFGGHGIAGTASGFGQLGLKPAIFWAWLVALVEFFGGLGILFGLLTRLSSFAIAINMLVAITLVHLKSGFFAQNGGFEYPLALFAMAVSLIISGPGAFALDPVVRRWIWKR
jgi:putative oxidoreductase